MAGAGKIVGVHLPKNYGQQPRFGIPVAPTLARLAACCQVLAEVKEKTGRTVLYALNVTGRADQLLAKARLLVENGTTSLRLKAAWNTSSAVSLGVSLIPRLRYTEAIFSAWTSRPSSFSASRRYRFAAEIPAYPERPGDSR